MHHLLSMQCRYREALQSWKALKGTQKLYRCLDYPYLGYVARQCVRHVIQPSSAAAAAFVRRPLGKYRLKSARAHMLCVHHSTLLAKHAQVCEHNASELRGALPSHVQLQLILSSSSSATIALAPNENILRRPARVHCRRKCRLLEVFMQHVMWESATPLPLLNFFVAR
jgi:hypothetical protein